MRARERVEDFQTVLALESSTNPPLACSLFSTAVSPVRAASVRPTGTRPPASAVDGRMKGRAVAGIIP